MSGNIVDWVADKLATNGEFEAVERTPEGFLSVKSRHGNSFLLAAIGVKGVIERSDVDPLFNGLIKPEFVVNVPSETKWRGFAIHRIHSEDSAFGTLGEVSKAARWENVGLYRNKDMEFFLNSIRQHGNVVDVSYVYQSVFRATRKIGVPLTIAVVEAYNLSAEDVRNARSKFGEFDIVVKSSSYGGVTNSAIEAARSIGAEAVVFKDLMKRLGK